MYSRQLAAFASLAISRAAFDEITFGDFEDEPRAPLSPLTPTEKQQLLKRAEATRDSTKLFLQETRAKREQQEAEATAIEVARAAYEKQRYAEGKRLEEENEIRAAEREFTLQRKHLRFEQKAAEFRALGEVQADELDAKEAAARRALETTLKQFTTQLSTTAGPRETVAARKAKLEEDLRAKLAASAALRAEGNEALRAERERADEARRIQVEAERETEAAEKAHIAAEKARAAAIKDALLVANTPDERFHRYEETKDLQIGWLMQQFRSTVVHKMAEADKFKYELLAHDVVGDLVKKNARLTEDLTKYAEYLQAASRDIGRLNREVASLKKDLAQLKQANVVLSFGGAAAKSQREDYGAQLGAINGVLGHGPLVSGLAERETMLKAENAALTQENLVLKRRCDSPVSVSSAPGSLGEEAQARLDGMVLDVNGGN